MRLAAAIPFDTFKQVSDAIEDDLTAWLELLLRDVDDEPIDKSVEDEEPEGSTHDRHHS